MAMLELLRGMDGNGYTVHGFRSSFRDWCAEQTNYPRELAEAALAHALKDKTEAAYQRGDLLEKRRRLMRAWARLLRLAAAGRGRGCRSCRTPSSRRAQVMDKKRLEALEVRLRAEAEEFEEEALKALQTGKRSARIQFTFASRDQAVVAVCDPKGPYLQTMPTEKAQGYVEIVNDAHKHLDVILDAYLDDDRRRATEYVRKLFQTIKTAQKLGRRPEPYKDAIRDKILAALAREPVQPRQARIEEAILKLCHDSISESCARNWAREFMAADHQRRQRWQ